MKLLEFRHSFIDFGRMATGTNVIVLLVYISRGTFRDHHPTITLDSKTKRDKPGKAGRQASRLRLFSHRLSILFITTVFSA